MKPSVSHLFLLFFPCAVRKSTAHVDKKALNIRHQVQKGFRSIFVVIPQHQKGYLVYVPSTRKIISSYDFFLYGFFLCISIYITTIFRIDGYVSVFVIHTLCYVFNGINWRYNHVRTLWRGWFIIWNFLRSGKQWQKKWWIQWWLNYVTTTKLWRNGCNRFWWWVRWWTYVYVDVRRHSWQKSILSER